jgi:hypothetical protein
MSDRVNRDRDFLSPFPSREHSKENVSARRKFLLLSAGFASSLLFSRGARAEEMSQPDGFQLPQARPQQVKPEFRTTLQQFGTFSQHPVYGEIWTPGAQTVPQGWHPYPPCHWVNSRKLGWYFDDKTPWGQIVHHYGRWKNEPSIGWFWTPGAEFSPGWVLWRSNPKYIGWTPLPPDQDLQNAQANAIENVDSWLFMDVDKFAKGCDGVVLPVDRYPVLLQETRFITRVKMVDGIVIYEFPTYVLGPIVDIDVIFAPWPLWFFTQILIFWNWIWRYVLIFNVHVNCEPNNPGGHTGGHHGRPALWRGGRGR